MAPSRIWSSATLISELQVIITHERRICAQNPVTLFGLGMCATRLPNGIDIGEVEVVSTPGKKEKIFTQVLGAADE